MNRRFIMLLANQSTSGPTYETPSYDNAGGTGDRMVDIRITGSAVFWGEFVDYLNTMLDGVNNSSVYPVNGAPVANEYTRFYFTNAVLITEVKLYLSTTLANCGTWKWQGSNNGTAWVDVSAAFVVSGVAGANVIGDLSANETAYKFYQLVGVSSTSAWTAYWLQFEFKIGNQIGLATNVLLESWRTAGASLFSLQSKVGVSNPIITATFVTDLVGMDSEGSYVADPFVIKDMDTWHLFFEALVGPPNNNAYLVCATSSDLLTWTYGRFLTVDGSAWSTSYPFVFNVDGFWWAVHDGDIVGQTIKLYRPTNWPYQWVTHSTIVTDAAAQFRDVSLFQWSGVWYMLAFDIVGLTLRLFFCSMLTGTWAEHPSSPLITGADSRPGGRPIVRAGVGVDILVQDGTPYYGNALRIYRLTSLTTTTCTITELATSPILSASGSGWNGAGMHQLDRVSPTVSIVDGFDVQPNGIYSIGLYEDAP